MTKLEPTSACAFFDAIASRYDREYAPERETTRARMERVVAELPARRPCRVLDLGVGTGRELPALLDAGFDVVGLDVSNEMLARCARRARPIPLVEADLWAPLPFAAGAFDAAIALHGTLAHPPMDLDATLTAVAAFAREVARTAPGTFVAEVPSPALLDAIERGELPTARRTGRDRFVHEDVATKRAIEARVLSAGAWKEAFEMAGFARVDVFATTTVDVLLVARFHA